MYITCLDLEGVLVPEIWIAFSEVSGIPELRRTTRDEPDYDKLMKWRMGILREHGLGLKQIQDVIAQIDPLPGAKEFLDELRAVDPERAARLSVSDVKRIVRALEIWQETGRTMTDFDRESRAIPPRYRPLWLGLHFPERAQLYARIDLRVELMYAQGLAQEVRALLDSGVPDRATSLQAIGYKQVVQALEEGLPPEAALGTIQQATRRYAKRQMTWFRANPAVQWLDASAGADEIFRAALQKAADFDSGI